ncbi:MAG: hypothetical protein WA667_26560 [Candidatus Nitrosopolaris sp.]
MDGHPKRERLGIFASPRATMYVDGSWYNVDINEIPSLAKNGTDVVFIEKRGAVEIVKHIGDIYGIAFVNTQGHFAEYPKDCGEKATVWIIGLHVIYLIKTRAKQQDQFIITTAKMLLFQSLFLNRF